MQAGGFGGDPSSYDLQELEKMMAVPITEVCIPFSLGGVDPKIDTRSPPPFLDKETGIVVASVMVSKQSWEYMGKRSAEQLPGTIKGIPPQVHAQVRNEVLIEFRKLGVVIGLLVPPEACSVGAVKKCLVRISRGVAKGPEKIEVRRYELMAGEDQARKLVLSRMNWR